MRHVLTLLTTILAMAVLAVAVPETSQARPSRGEPVTVRAEIEILHNLFGVNFIYDSSLDLDIPYKGRPMKEIAKGQPKDDETGFRSSGLTVCLDALFKDTGIA